MIQLLLLSLAIYQTTWAEIDPDLPPEHSEYYRKAVGKCWGYEDDCKEENSFSKSIECDTDLDPYSGRVSRDIFFDEADFGYVRTRISSFMSICEPRSPKESSLVCSKHLQFCTGRNIMIDFEDLPSRRAELLRYSMDVLKPGKIGGKCLLHKARLDDNMQYVAPLQSWAPELRNFVELSSDPLNDESSSHCDVYIDKPSFIMKIDASVNYYHHFCDFLNLYASLHINSTHPEMFSKDVRVLIWENRPYQSNFADAFKAFTDHPILDLTSYEGKKVCFKNLVLPLLPRMIYGLYYNTPLFSNCRNSGLFRAFAQFMPHRLKIESTSVTDSNKIRVTVIKRLTKYRRILNLGTLVEALESTGKYEVTVAEFSHGMPFRKQLEIVRKTDVLVGVHGAGLTHMLFLPDWAAVFEVYNCEDPSCYSELARLRGVKYFTWEKQDLVYPEDKGHHPSDPDKGHAKFTNYSFDPDEFVRIINLASHHVQSHPEFTLIDRSRKIVELHQEL